MRGGFRPRLFRIYRLLLAIDDVIVKRIFYVRRYVYGIEQSLSVGFIFGEQQFRRAFAMKPATAQHEMFEFNCRRAMIGRCVVHDRLRIVVVAPAPAVAEPNGREQITLSCFWSASCRGNLD